MSSSPILVPLQEFRKYPLYLSDGLLPESGFVVTHSHFIKKSSLRSISE